MKSPDRRGEERLPDLPQAVRLIGRTVSFRGKVDNYAAEKFFGLPEEVRRNADTLSFSRATTIYGSGIIPVVAYYRSLKKGIRVRADRNPHAERLLRLYGYGTVLERGFSRAAPPFSQAIRSLATDEETYPYEQIAFDDAAKRMRNVARNIVPGFYWALSELIGNVFHHAEAPDGAIVQYLVQVRNRRLTFTLVDTGIGLLKSLSENHRNIVSDRQAIQEAIRLGVTSKRENLGMGLFGSTRIVQLTGGNMLLWSGSASMWVDSHGAFHFRDVPYFQGTVVEWQLPVDAHYDLQEALKLPEEPVIWLSDKYTNGGLSDLKLRLIDESRTFGNRAAGRKLQTKLLNLIRQSRTKHVEVDFSNVSAMSSSFVDEFIAKTMVLYGEKFDEFVSLTNLSANSRQLLESAIQHRLRAERSARTPLRVVEEQRSIAAPGGTRSAPKHGRVR
jgi:STAS-like domain of unknown function (DUF4325)